MTKLTIVENFRAVFYAPFYALRSLGFAQEEGLEIEWIDGVAPGNAVQALKRGEFDLTWGGPMRVMDDRDRNGDGDDALLGFCQVVARDPFYLIAAQGAGDLDLRDLPLRRLAVVSEVPTPWLCLQADLADAGVDVAALLADHTRVMPMTMPAQLDALSAGTIDLAQLFEPHVSRAIAAKQAQIAYAACERGPTVYTTFICTQAGMARNHVAFAQLTRAMQRTLTWMRADPHAFLDRVAPYFPDVDPTHLRSAFSRYDRDQVWAQNTTVSQSGFARLADSLHRGGFIRSPGCRAACIHDF